MTTRLILTETQSRRIYSHYLFLNKHRPNGPASMWLLTNRNFWYLYGQRHRYYGPAENEFFPGTDDYTGNWYLHGDRVK